MNHNQNIIASFSGIFTDSFHPLFGALNFNKMEKEIWKDIPNYKGLYQASNLGRVKSLRRKRANDSLILKERILKPAICGHGYRCVVLYNHNGGKTHKVAQLVVSAFLNYKRNKTSVIDHIDNVRTNDNLNNLQIITKRLNDSKDKKGCFSKYTGVYRYNNKFCSKVKVNGKCVYLGSYDTEIEASNVYQNYIKTLDE